MLNNVVNVFVFYHSNFIVAILQCNCNFAVQTTLQCNCNFAVQTTLQLQLCSATYTHTDDDDDDDNDDIVIITNQWYNNLDETY